ncbi:PIG-L family deacetylase [Pseudomonas sp.]|uniref:PIG-L deacetylase family protein n=1 Tax=Pseudomonas sp. TaxID=306 RepID=UPI002B7A8731|nr:PIG-L family deacetylase [Pseudomonas sp.]HUE91249.1 PIG-L family deacetylase [Pseudomonas sp.]
MSKSVLVVAAHADDEALGCGGTLARHVAEGDRVHVLFLADGVTARVDVDRQAQQRRQRATEQACAELGVTELSFLGLPDNRLDSLPLLEVVQPLEALLARLKPQLIYTHHMGDLNVDHQVAHQAVLIASRPLPGQSVREILTFEVMSSSEWSNPGYLPFLPNHFVDISAQLLAKLAALDCYAEEMRPAPHSRSRQHLAALALHRGHSVGVAAAEAFMLVRRLQ